MSTVVAGLIGAAPYLIAWIVAVIVAVMMLRRGGGRAERFFLAGSSLMLVKSLVRIPKVALVPWLAERGMDRASIASVFSGFSLLLGCIGLAGTLCLIYAFWTRFKARPQAM